MSTAQQVDAWVAFIILVLIILGIIIGLGKTAARGIFPFSVISAVLSALGCLMFAYDVARWAGLMRERTCGMCGFAILAPVLLTVILLLMGLACALIACAVGLSLTVRQRQPLWALILALGSLAPALIIAARITGFLPPFSLEERPMYPTYALLLLPSLVITAYASTVRRNLRAREGLAPFTGAG